jgi:hypothetical protein
MPAECTSRELHAAAGLHRRGWNTQSVAAEMRSFPAGSFSCRMPLCHTEYIIAAH